MAVPNDAACWQPVSAELPSCTKADRQQTTPFKPSPFRGGQCKIASLGVYRTPLVTLAFLIAVAHIPIGDTNIWFVCPERRGAFWLRSSSRPACMSATMARTTSKRLLLTISDRLTERSVSKVLQGMVVPSCSISSRASLPSNVDLGHRQRGECRISKWPMCRMTLLPKVSCVEISYATYCIGGNGGHRVHSPPGLMHERLAGAEGEPLLLRPMWTLYQIAEHAQKKPDFQTGDRPAPVNVT